MTDASLDLPVRPDPADRAAPPAAGSAPTPALPPVAGDASVALGVAAAARVGWRESAGATAGRLRERPELVAVGLLGFLARGGLVAFLLPIVVLPTPTGISNFLGGTALTGAGASEGLIRLIVTLVTVLVVALVTGIAVGAVADTLLAREARALVVARGRGIVTDVGLAAVERESAAAVPVTAGLVGRLIVVRVVSFIPLALALGWATARLVAAAYHQLILPDDLSVPLAVRTLREASDAAIVVLVAWLAVELVGGLAVRHVILGRRGIGGAFAGAARGFLRRPATTLATYVLGTIGLALIALPTLLVSALLWSRLQALLADDVPILQLVPATFVFVLAWLAGLAIVGVIVTWRSIVLSTDVLRGMRGRRESGSAAMPDPIGMTGR